MLINVINVDLDLIYKALLVRVLLIVGNLLMASVRNVIMAIN